MIAIFSCHCPSCGHEIQIPRWLPRTVTCKECHAKSVVPYEQDPDYDNYNALAKIKVKSNNFRTVHPNITKGIVITCVAVVGLAWLSTKKDDSGNNLLTVEPSEEPPEEQSRPISIASETRQEDSLPAESLSETEEAEPVHREYSPHNPDDYDYVLRHHDIAMIHFTKGQQASQEKRDEFKEKTGNDLPPDTSFKKAYDQQHQVKKT